MLYKLTKKRKHLINEARGKEILNFLLPPLDFDGCAVTILVMGYKLFCGFEWVV